MADGTVIPAGSGGDGISTDELSTLNGAAAPLVGGLAQKVQRTKTGFGVDGGLRDVSAQFGLPVNIDPQRAIAFKGRSCSFKNPGRATVSQKILSIHNAVGSAVIVDINRMRVDMLSTVVKAVTVVPPVVRIVRYTTLQTGGTVLTKNTLKTALTSNASVTVTGDASADNTLSGTTLTLTPTGTLAQAYAPRMLTAVGYEFMDTVEFFLGETDVTLAAGEGLAVFLDAATVTTGIPATDAYIASVDWAEYTAAV